MTHRRDSLPAPSPAPGLSGVPWDNGQITLRVRPQDTRSSRIVRSRGPVFLVGRHPAADLVLADRRVAPRHLMMVLDRRGLFCVDLLSRTGTRFAGQPIGSIWLGAGDVVELAGTRLEILRLRSDGTAIDPTPPGDEVDPFAPADPRLDRLVLLPDPVGPPPWIVASSLALLGRSDACGLRVVGQGLAPIHAALWRDHGAVHLIDMATRRTRVNDQPISNPTPIRSGDEITLGQARFRPVIGTDQLVDLLPARIEQARVPASLQTHVVGDPGFNDVLELLRQFQSDAATLIEGQFDQIEALRRDLAALRDDLRDKTPQPEPVEPFAINVRPALPPASGDQPPGETAAWLLERLNAVETEPEQRSRWRDLIGRITAALPGQGNPQDRS